MIAFEVNDMTCGHCVRAITEAVHCADNGARVQVDLAAHRVQIEPVAAQASFERATRLRPAAGRWWVRLALAAERAGDERTARDAIGRVAPAALDVDGLALRRRLLAGAPGGVSGR